MRLDRTKANRKLFEENKKILMKTETVCAICGKPIDFDAPSYSPLAPSVDHIIPVSKWGEHIAAAGIDPSESVNQLSNLQLTHRACNRAKSDKVVMENPKKPQNKPISNRILPQMFDWEGYREG